MRIIANSSVCENGRDKILSVCQEGPDGTIEHDIIIQRGPKEYDFIDDAPGPRISFDTFGLDLTPGPDAIVFSGHIMTLLMSGYENIEVDLSGLDEHEIRELKAVATALFK